MKNYLAKFWWIFLLRGVFSIANAQLGRTRNDKPYLRCLIGDR